MQCPALALVRTAPDAIRGGGEDFRRLAQADGHAVNILVDWVAPERREMRPGIPAIPAAEDPVYLNPHPDRAGIPGVKHDVRDLGRAR